MRSRRSARSHGVPGDDLERCSSCTRRLEATRTLGSGPGQRQRRLVVSSSLAALEVDAERVNAVVPTPEQSPRTDRSAEGCRTPRTRCPQVNASECLLPSSTLCRLSADFNGQKLAADRSLVSGAGCDCHVNSLMHH